MAQFRSALTQADLISAATVTCNPGVYTRLGARVIQAGEQLSVGFGQETGQQNAQGRIFVQLMDNSASPGVALKGKLRFSVVTPQDRPLVVLYEFRTETLSSGSGDRTKQVPLPENMYAISEDKKLILEFLPDGAAAVTVGQANTTITMDITEVQV